MARRHAGTRKHSTETYKSFWISMCDLERVFQEHIVGIIFSRTSSSFLSTAAMSPTFVALFIADMLLDFSCLKIPNKHKIFHDCFSPLSCLGPTKPFAPTAVHAAEAVWSIFWDRSFSNQFRASGACARCEHHRSHTLRE